MRHVIEAQQFDHAFLTELFALADAAERTQPQILQGRIMASLFYEPSTRTRLSFESAMLRLGGNLITTENASEFSSAIKGETLEDTVRVISAYADVIVLRHFEEGASRKAAVTSGVPVINAGDGPGQHPTQALLDLYTIQRELGRTEDLAIAFVGDPKHGRTIRSLAYLLGRYRNVSMHFISPPGLRVGRDIIDYLERHGVRYEESEDLAAVIGSLDVLYQTRIQKERFAAASDYEQCRGRYCIDAALVARMKEPSIIMHPLPRVDEILPEVDSSPKAAYFRQARYGVLVRMALLQFVLGVSGSYPAYVPG